MVTRLFTGKGDQGTTDLLGGRVDKDDPRIEAIGALDETDAALGLARATATSDRVRELVLATQRDLYTIMAELAFTADMRPKGYGLAEERVLFLERETDALTAEVALPPQFVVPGESVSGATLDVARTVARRAERRVVTLARGGHVENAAVARYLNRLSSLLFILARLEDKAGGVAVRLAKAGPSS